MLVFSLRLSVFAFTLSQVSTGCCLDNGHLKNASFVQLQVYHHIQSFSCKFIIIISFASSLMLVLSTESASWVL